MGAFDEPHMDIAFCSQIYTDVASRVLPFLARRVKFSSRTYRMLLHSTLPWVQSMAVRESYRLRPIEISLSGLSPPGL